MKITLAIPAYNEEKYIGECLEHAAAQRDFLHEILVIDNASTDKTAEVASRFPGVRVVREERKGLTRARARALAEATGDIIAFNDADTHMPPGWVARVAEAYEKDPKLACISGPYIYWDAGPVTSALVWLYWRVLGMPMYLFHGFMAVGGNFAAKKQALLDIGGFDTDIEFYGEDTNIARRLSKVGRVYFTLSLPMYTSARRFHGDGLIATAWRYMVNFASEAFFKKSVTDKYTDIR
ncbi:MAG TPA: glycosyltransferase family A protein [Candidatus Paceibacterota bacterium]